MGEAALADILPRTVDEFDDWHARQPERWEFVDGRPRLMAPASLRHTIVKGNAFAALRAALKGSKCRAYVDGVQIRTDTISAIPDVAVSCTQVDDLNSPEVQYPVVIIEVLSPSSEDDDIGRKWRSYRQIPSLQHYLVVSQSVRQVEIHSRTGPFSWDERYVHDGVIALTAIGATLDLDELYADTGVGAEPEQPAAASG